MSVPIPGIGGYPAIPSITCVNEIYAVSFEGNKGRHYGKFDPIDGYVLQSPLVFEYPPIKIIVTSVDPDDGSVSNFVVLAPVPQVQKRVRRFGLKRA
jgi:hypothetical protein